MSDDFDINQVAVEFVQRNLDRLADAAAMGFKGAKNAVRSKLKSTYEDYLKRLLDRHSKAKSFFIRSEPTPLYRFFVPLTLSTQHRTIEQATIADLSSCSYHSIVLASGGSGKTMMMRHLLIGCVRGGAKVPVFIELRDFNNLNVTISDCIVDSLRVHGLEVDHAYLEIALRAGHFCLLFDGYDELDLSLRKPIAKQINDLATTYSDNWIVISSRPDSELYTLANFTQFRIDPLDLNGAVTLVQRLPFDSPLKEKFVTDLKTHLFESHKSFLSNPLLLSIMLLTYNDIGHIPSKLSLFYTQAFDSLFQRHDAFKGGFQRQRRTTLDIQEFARAFSAFCILTYDKRDFTFSRTSSLEYFSRAKSLCQLNYDSQAILEDALQAVCLLIENGLDITFAHRSFQEYFVAKFISSCQESDKERLIKRYAHNSMADAVMELLYEIDPQAVERHLILPTIAELKSRIDYRGIVGKTSHQKYVKWLFEGFHMDEGEGGVMAAVNDQKIFNPVSFLHKHVLPKDTWTSEDELKEWLKKAIELWNVEFSSDTDDIQVNRMTRSRFHNHLMAGPNLFGVSFIRNVIKLEEKILGDHERTRMSLLELLN